MIMAKKATSKSASGATKRTRSTSRKSPSRSVVRATSGGGSRSGAQDGTNAGDAFIKLLQSPLVADLIAVAATAALASLAEQGFSRGGADKHRAGRAVKAAGKAAAAAIGRRLGTEIDEIRKASSASKSGAKA
jgi:hypothetical protein